MPWTAAAPCELLKLSDMADALHRGVLLILVRLGVAYGLCALFYALFGYEGFLGISGLRVRRHQRQRGAVHGHHLPLRRQGR